MEERDGAEDDGPELRALVPWQNGKDQSAVVELGFEFFCFAREVRVVQIHTIFYFFFNLETKRGCGGFFGFGLGLGSKVLERLTRLSDTPSDSSPSLEVVVAARPWVLALVLALARGRGEYPSMLP